MTPIFKFFKNVFSNDKEPHEVPVSNDVHELLAQNRERILRNRTEREEREKAKRKAKESAAGASSSVTSGDDAFSGVPSLAALSSPYSPWQYKSVLDEYELDEDTPEPGDDDYVESVEEGASEGEECSTDDDRDEACADSDDSGSGSDSSSDDSYSSSYDSGSSYESSYDSGSSYSSSSYDYQDSSSSSYSSSSSDSSYSSSSYDSGSSYSYDSGSSDSGSFGD